MPGAVARGRLGAGGAAVVEVVQRGQRLPTIAWLRPPGQVGQEGDPAGVVLERRVVEALGAGRAENGALHGSPVAAMPTDRRAGSAGTPSARSRRGAAQVTGVSRRTEPRWL